MNKFNPTIEDDPNINPEFPATMMPLLIKSNGEQLVGSFFKASGKESKPLVLLLHGFPGNESNFDVAHAIRRFGMNVAVFHYRGSWGSSGDFSISNSLEDAGHVVEYFSKEENLIKYNNQKDNIILIGHSMGGFLAMLTSLKFQNIKNVGFLAGFNFGLFAKFLSENPQYIEQTMEGLKDGPRFLTNSSAQKIFDEMTGNIDEWNLLNHLTEIKDKNILLIAAENDQVAPTQLHHFPLLEGLNKVGTKTKNVVIKCGHSFSSSRIRLTTEIIEWLKSIKL